ncbi:MAG TPA: hypothetical protein VK864_01675 [Longimicrobiales bacterium]|nr:hypothetical protein [Longimicrobiales bacterium]
MYARTRAFELDPFAVVINSNYGQVCYLARDFDCAINHFRRTLEPDSTWATGHWRLGVAYARKNLLGEAVRTIRRGVDLAPERPDFLADLAGAQALAGDTSAARATLARAKQRPREGFSIARAYVALGEPDSAFAWLERSSWQWPHRAARADPALDPLRSHPRFARLVARVDREMGMR